MQIKQDPVTGLRARSDAAKAAEKKAQGLSYRKGPDGKQHWLPRAHKGEGI